MYRPPPRLSGAVTVLELIVALVSESVPLLAIQAAASDAGGVAADRAVAQSGRATVQQLGHRRLAAAVLPLTVTFERVSVPPSFSRPPPYWAAAADRQARERRGPSVDVEHPAGLPLPLTVRSPAPGPLIVVVALSESESWAFGQGDHLRQAKTSPGRK